MTPYTTRKFSQKGGISVTELCKEPRYAHYVKYSNKMKGKCNSQPCLQHPTNIILVAGIAADAVSYMIFPSRT